MNPDRFQSKVVSASGDGRNLNFGQYSEVLSQLKEDRLYPKFHQNLNLLIVVHSRGMFVTLIYRLILFDN